MLNVNFTHGAEDCYKGFTRRTHICCMPQLHNSAADIRMPYVMYINNSAVEMLTLLWRSIEQAYRD